MAEFLANRAACACAGLGMPRAAAPHSVAEMCPVTLVTYAIPCFARSAVEAAEKRAR
jgi:hypothetical protein